MRQSNRIQLLGIIVRLQFTAYLQLSTFILRGRPEVTGTRVDLLTFDPLQTYGVPFVSKQRFWGQA